VASPTSIQAHESGSKQCLHICDRGFVAHRATTKTKAGGPGGCGEGAK